MTIEAAFLSMMPTTVVVYSLSSNDKYGKPTFSASGTSTRCRVVPNSVSSRSATGVDEVSDGKIYFYGTPTVTLTDKLLLNGVQLTVKSIQVQNDENGSHHTVVTYGA